MAKTFFLKFEAVLVEVTRQHVYVNLFACSEAGETRYLYNTDMLSSINWIMQRVTF